MEEGWTKGSRYSLDEVYGEDTNENEKKRRKLSN
jgi:hypothetical protein